MAEKAEKKSNTRSRIISYVMNHQNTSKVEISRKLNISMPTVLSNVNELLDRGILVETGRICFHRRQKGKEHRD